MSVGPRPLAPSLTPTRPRSPQNGDDGNDDGATSPRDAPPRALPALPALLAGADAPALEEWVCAVTLSVLPPSVVVKVSALSTHLAPI